MSTVILHDKTRNNWQSLGIGPLVDAMNPKVIREKHGVYELRFHYPIFSPLFKELKIGRWVVSDAGARLEAKAQKFEIATISKPQNGIVEVYCEHYSYKLLRSIVKLGSALKNIPAQTALSTLKSLMEPKNDFEFYSDVTTKASINFSEPGQFANAQEALGGVRGSILDNFGGEYLFNNNHVRLLRRAGRETNVVVAYGKNLTDIHQEESIETTYTSVFGWARVGNGDNEKILTLPETYVDSEHVNKYSERRILMVDFSDKNPTDVAALRSHMKAYVKNNKVGIPKVSIKTKFADLSSAVVGDHVKALEEIDLCDTVTIAFNELGINTEAQIIKTTWNVALDNYESCELGEARTNFTSVLEETQAGLETITNKVNWLEQAQKEASDIINNPGKGHVVIYPSIADPQEILIMDTKNINTAKKVWRWNAGGLGFSSTGYNGTYGLAMTNNGAIVADRITAGTLRAIKIIGVTIEASVFKGNNLLINADQGTIDVLTDKAPDVPGRIRARLSKGALNFTYEGENGIGGARSRISARPYRWSGGQGRYSPSLQLFSSSLLILSTDEAEISILEKKIRLATKNRSVLELEDRRISMVAKGQLDLGGSLVKVRNRMQTQEITATQLNVSGSKNAIHPTRDGVRATPAYELAESYLGDIGRSVTNENCEVWVPVEALFSDTVNLDIPYEVFLQVYDDARVWVSDFKSDAFLVRSDKPGVRFAWELKAKRIGYEKERMVLQDWDNKEIENSLGPEEYREKEANIG